MYRESQTPDVLLDPVRLRDADLRSGPLADPCLGPRWRPEQLTKTRDFGGWSNQKRAAYLDRCRQLLGEPDAAGIEDVPAPDEAGLRDETSPDEAQPRCPHCEEPALRLLHESAKPSWSDLLNHHDPRCPEWYAELDLAEQRGYLLEAYGIDYDDWYRETQVESAMGSSLAAPPIQLYLAGMCPAPDFQLESL